MKSACDLVNKSWIDSEVFIYYKIKPFLNSVGLLDASFKKTFLHRMTSSISCFFFVIISLIRNLGRYRWKSFGSAPVFAAKNVLKPLWCVCVCVSARRTGLELHNVHVMYAKLSQKSSNVVTVQLFQLKLRGGLFIITSSPVTGTALLKCDGWAFADGCYSLWWLSQVWCAKTGCLGPWGEGWGRVEDKNCSCCCALFSMDCWGSNHSRTGAELEAGTAKVSVDAGKTLLPFCQASLLLRSVDPHPHPCLKLLWLF